MRYLYIISITTYSQIYTTAEENRIKETTFSTIPLFPTHASRHFRSSFSIANLRKSRSSLKPQIRLDGDGNRTIKNWTSWAKTWDLKGFCAILYFTHQYFLSKPCGFHVRSMWVPCGFHMAVEKKNVMSFRKTNMLGQFGIATTDACCETWVRMLNIIQPSFSSNSQWDSKRVEPKTFKSRTLNTFQPCVDVVELQYDTTCVYKYIYITLCVSDNLLRWSIYLQLDHDGLAPGYDARIQKRRPQNAHHSQDAQEGEALDIWTLTLNDGAMAWKTTVPLVYLGTLR